MLTNKIGKFFLFVSLAIFCAMSFADTPSGGSSTNRSDGLLYNFWFNSPAGQTGGTGLETDNYRGLEVLIEGLQSDASTIGLTSEAIQTRIELRLLQSNIRPKDRTSGSSNPYIYTNVSVVDDAFNIELSYRRPIYYDDSPYFYIQLGETWSVSTTGTHGESSVYLLEQLDGLLDIFLRDYLAANMN